MDTYPPGEVTEEWKEYGGARVGLWRILSWVSRTEKDCGKRVPAVMRRMGLSRGILQLILWMVFFLWFHIESSIWIFNWRKVNSQLHVLPVCISLVLAFEASMSLRKIVNFINLFNIFFILLSLASPATGLVLELTCFIVCVEVVLCWTNHVLHQLVLEAVKWGRKSYCLSWRVSCLSTSQENANMTRFRFFITCYICKVVVSDGAWGQEQLGCPAACSHVLTL